MPILRSSLTAVAAVAAAVALLAVGSALAPAPAHAAPCAVQAGTRCDHPDFSGMDLRNADFSRANLVGARFVG